MHVGGRRRRDSGQRFVECPSTCQAPPRFDDMPDEVDPRVNRLQNGLARVQPNAESCRQKCVDVAQHRVKPFRRLVQE
ncbi:conserved hypothetical protein [Ricinus communis]|uniref:Uncharacterized protein n=1 Tax=Ricinus communis TaxID=3988 RepID=B9TNP0_RICCO|nr:conserved hypothetical protein [Ricinus communis]